MRTILQNETLRAEIDTLGGEVKSLVCHGRQYLWQGDPAFWGRTSPILFPIVGKVDGGRYRVDGREYLMGQHGFARDSEFCLLENDNRHVLLRLTDTEASAARYPYRFALTVCHRLEGRTLQSHWTVKNRDSSPLYFQIGAHPAFLLPDYSPADALHGFVALDGNAPYRLPLERETFAHDALIYEDNTLHTATLMDKAGSAVLSLHCPQAEVWGVWAPYKEGCPFVCLEPWCGRKDNPGFCGDITQRDYIHRLAPQQQFLFEYAVTLF